MNISSMSNVNWEKSPNIKATCTIRTSEGFLIKECKVINGMHGIFVASPSKPSSKKRLYKAIACIGVYVGEYIAG